ncbi:MAG TPA: hypothetical protein DCE41_35335 [Cytophagales bacterium]|nr:hypothetical protein [Cytophagales bacterium]
MLKRGEYLLENGTGLFWGEGLTLGYNNLLLRFALLDAFEIRLGPSAAILVSSSADTLNRYQIGNSLGVKFRLVETGRFQLSLLPTAYLLYAPNTWVRGESVAWEGVLLASYALSDAWSVDTNVGVQGGGLSPFSLSYTLLLNGTLTSKVGVFAELYGQAMEGSANLQWDAGLTYLPTPRLQLDVSGGYSPWASSGFVEIGASYGISTR